MKPILASLCVLAKAYDYKSHGNDWVTSSNSCGETWSQSPVDLPTWNMFTGDYSFEEDNTNKMYYN